jgi:hypothetical protein
VRLRFWQQATPDPAPRIVIERRTHQPRSRRPDRHEENELLAWLEQLPEGEARAIRMDAGWTQADVAKACGGGSVSRWERDGTGWSRHTGVRYARLLQELAVMRDDVTGDEKDGDAVAVDGVEDL